MMTRINAPSRAPIRFGFLMREQVAARHFLMALEKHGVRDVMIKLETHEAFDRLHLYPYPPMMPEAQQKQLRRQLEQVLPTMSEVSKSPGPNPGFCFRKMPIDIHLSE